MTPCPRILAPSRWLRPEYRYDLTLTGSGSYHDLTLTGQPAGGDRAVDSDVTSCTDSKWPSCAGAQSRSEATFDKYDACNCPKILFVAIGGGWKFVTISLNSWAIGQSFQTCVAPFVRDWPRAQSVSRVGGAQCSARVSRGTILCVRRKRKCTLVPTPGALGFDAAVQPIQPSNGFEFCETVTCRA